MGKVRKHIMLSTELEEKVLQYSKKKGLNQSDVINLCVEYFFKHGGRDFPEFAQIFDALLKKYTKDMKEEQKKVLLAVNRLSRESEMNLELWNHHLILNGDRPAITRDAKQSVGLQQVESSVSSRIEKERQKKLSR